MHPFSRSTILAALIVSSLVVTSSTVALAEGNEAPPQQVTKKSKKKKGAATTAKKVDVVFVAFSETLPPLPATEPSLPPAPTPAPTKTAAPASNAAVATSSPTAVKDQSAATPPSTERAPAGTGFVLVVGSGMGFLGGKIADRLNVGAGFVNFDLKLGAYVTPHFGLMGGIQAGYGALFDGCVGECTKAYAYQLPLVAQYSFQDRSRGAYLEGGLALLTTYGGSTDRATSAYEHVEMSAPFDLKAAVGYRIPNGGNAEKAATSALDLRFGMDVGQFKSVEYGYGSASFKGEVASEKQAMHVALGISLGYHFAP